MSRGSHEQDALRLFNVCVQRKQQLSPDDAEPASAEIATQPYVPGSHPVIAKVAELIKSLFILLDTCIVRTLLVRVEYTPARVIRCLLSILIIKPPPT